jgi:putative nucleotidyltransferase with HDIG domain
MESRVARRILLLFTLGAVVPVAVLAMTSFLAVSGQLREQGEERLDRLSDLAAQSILGRVLNVRTLLDVSARAGLEARVESMSLPPGLEGIALVDVGGGMRVLAGEMDVPAELSGPERAHLRSGEALIRTVTGGGPGPPAVLMAVSPWEAEDVGVLWARLTADSLWSAAVTQVLDETVDEMCILDSSGVPHFCSAGAENSLAPNVPVAATGAIHAGFLEIDRAGGRMGAWRAILLGAGYRSPPWTLAISQSLESMRSPVSVFAYNFVVTLFIVLVMILLLTYITVRRTMEPLAELTEGTRRIADQDLSTRVQVASQDEFGDLAASFNTMAERLGFQFRQIEAGRSIDRAVLTANDRREAVQALLLGLGQVARCGARGVFLLETGSNDQASFFEVDGDGGTMVLNTLTVPRTGGDQNGLPDEAFVAEMPAAVPAVLRPLIDGVWSPPLMMLPLVARGEAFGLVAVGSTPGGRIEEGDYDRSRRLVDQAAVGLNELRLRAELIETSWEALRALANTIDAKSKWTAGHSQRVTELALLLGREVGLGEREMDMLHRGGLLHDIGKIGVDAAILDFPGPLDAEARAAVQEHTRIGAHILAPLTSFKPVLPIVLHHHERWDGKGYPDGLRGEAIHPLARLLAVADVFDAMVSARPYRAAIDPKIVRAEIVAEAGTAFDPAMVRAFEAVLDAGWTPLERETFHA